MDSLELYYSLLRVKRFPSPYGVSFILIIGHDYNDIVRDMQEFPSPYGVSFILIWLVFGVYCKVDTFTGFRLLTEYHSFLFYDVVNGESIYL